MIKRSIYLNKIEDLIDVNLIKVIMGVRRSGKTVLLQSVMEKLIDNGVNENNIIYIPFESQLYDGIINYKDLNKYVQEKTRNISGKIYFLFDEIQLVENWEKSVNSYRVDYDSDIYITGSNSTLLNGELSTLLSGRYIELHIYPFSFNEVNRYYESKNRKITDDELFQEYLLYGGFPEVLQLKESLKDNYLDSLYDSIVLKDIISNNNIRDVDMLNRLLNFLIDNTGRVFSANSISKYLKRQQRKISVNKILNYITYMRNANIILKCQREDLRGKKILNVLEKYYVVDQGLYHRLKGRNKIDYGQILENLVYIELLRRDYRVNIGKINDTEIDFVCKKENIIKYIQVSLSIIDENTRKREFKPLNDLKDNYDKIVISTDKLNFSENGIKHINIIDFLKDEKL